MINLADVLNKKKAKKIKRGEDIEALNHLRRLSKNVLNSNSFLVH